MVPIGLCLRLIGWHAQRSVAALAPIGAQAACCRKARAHVELRRHSAALPRAVQRGGVGDAMRGQVGRKVPSDTIAARRRLGMHTRANARRSCTRKSTNALTAAIVPIGLCPRLIGWHA
jgi:poly(3-hydroxybutyrate) depolymerase